MLKEETVLDAATLLAEAGELSELICRSETMAHYIACKKELEQDREAQRKISAFQIKKDEYEEVQRFGKWHPDYERVTKETRQLKRELERLEVVSRFKQAEFKLEELLFEVSKIIAGAVSDTIKVPSDHPLLSVGGGGCGTGCGTGGSCGCRTS